MAWLIWFFAAVVSSNFNPSVMSSGFTGEAWKASSVLDFDAAAISLFVSVYIWKLFLLRTLVSIAIISIMSEPTTAVSKPNSEGVAEISNGANSVAVSKEIAKEVWSEGTSRLRLIIEKVSEMKESDNDGVKKVIFCFSFYLVLCWRVPNDVSFFLLQQVTSIDSMVNKIGVHGTQMDELSGLVNKEAHQF
jgi:hypothetical protein